MDAAPSGKIRVRWTLLSVALASSLLACQQEDPDGIGPSSGGSSQASGGLPSDTGGSGGAGKGTGSGHSGGSAGDEGTLEIDWGDCDYDPGLQANIRLALEGTGLSSVRELTALSASQWPYEGLEGIECLENLERLGLTHIFPYEDRPPIDFSPLGQLGSLEELLVSSVVPSHLDVLANTPLRDLILIAVELESLEPLGALSQVEHLELNTLPVGDLAPLSNLGSLKWLRLSSMPVSSLAGIAHLPHLETLALSWLEFADFRGLEDLPALTELWLVYDDFHSFEGMKDLPRLKSVVLEGCLEVESLDGLEVCESLETLAIRGDQDGSKVSDIDALGKVPSLKRLELPQAKVSDLGPLSSCIELEHLDLSGNQLTDVGPLADLGLKWLDLSDNRVESIETLSDMPLTTLRISHNPLTSIDPIATLDELEVLHIDGLGVSSLSLLRDFPIQELSAADNQIVDIEVVMNWDLSQLNLANNQITKIPKDFVGAQGFCALTDLRGNPLDDEARTSLEGLCQAPRHGPGYHWDDGECFPTCEVP